MAKKLIEKNVRAAITRENKNFKNKFFPSALGGTTLVEFTWGTDALINGCIKGTSLILSRSRTNKLLTPDEVKYYSASNTKEMWESIARKISLEAKRNNIIGGTGFKKHTVGKTMTGSPMYQINFSDIGLKRPKTWSLLFLIPGPASNGQRTLKLLYDNLTQEMWDKFQYEVAGLFASDLPGRTRVRSRKGRTSPTLYSAFRSGVQKEHDVPTTTALQTIQALKKSKLQFNAGLELKEHDLYDQVIKALGVKLLQKKVKTRAKKYKVNNVISIFLGPNPNFGKTDMVNVRKEYIKAVNKAIQEDKESLSPKRTMSTPIAEQASDDVIKEVITTITKGRKRKNLKKTVKSKAKTFKNEERNIELIKPEKIARTQSTPFVIDIKGVLPEQRISQSGKKEKTISLTALKGKINRSLPAEVRRNMGRPALINRTGRFSNSVVLNTLREGPKSLIGEYSYQLDPYQTFENLGIKQWTNGYNPKPLIAKSIRNLAQKHVEAQFTLRRV